MAGSKATTAVAAYLTELRRIQASGGATGERSAYGALTDLLKRGGRQPAPQGLLRTRTSPTRAPAIPTSDSTPRARPNAAAANANAGGQLPERGVVEVKPAADDAWLTADGEQVSRYWQRYRQVLVTNTRDFVMVGEDASGQPARLETFRLADSADDFHARLEHPRAFANEVGVGLGEYLCRALSNAASLAEPKDLAWLLASYARDGLARVERAGDPASLAAVRSALEESLGVRFEGDRGAAFFRSTLVQTLFYGVFSAWALWARQTPAPSGPFNWHEAVWHLRAPGAPRPVPAAFRPRTPATPGLGGSAGLGRRRAQPGQPHRLLRPFPRGRGRALLLRTLPAGFRPRPAQATRRLVHPRRGCPLHGGPR